MKCIACAVVFSDCVSWIESHHIIWIEMSRWKGRNKSPCK